MGVPGDPFYNILNHFALQIRHRGQAVFHRPRIENTPERQNYADHFESHR